MLTVYDSNRLEVLSGLLTRLVRQPNNSPFVPETLIVQSLGIARRLSFRLADDLAACARVHYPFPAAFIWELFRRMLTNVPETSPFPQDVLSWRIMALLEELQETPCLTPLQAYCTDGDDFTHFALASRTASVFDQNLVYRPDWIVQWERGIDDD